VNAAGDHETTISIVLVHARQMLTTPIASGLQVCGDRTRTLTERVVRLEKPRQSSKVDRTTDVMVSYPIPRRRGAIRGYDLRNRIAR
jgi:hypothetical protein